MRLKPRSWWTLRKTEVAALVGSGKPQRFFLRPRPDNGKFLSATPFVTKLNWAKGVDASGHPILSGKIPTAKGEYICPGIDGATNWYSPSYNPDTKLFYVMALESCDQYFTIPRKFHTGETFYNTGTGTTVEHSQKILLRSVADGKPV